MKIKLLILVCFCFVNIVFGQKENYVWYFGSGVALDFNSGSPVTLNDSVLFTFEGCATLCDSNGSTLFYTDGVHVYGKNHLQMPHGDSLAGGYFSTQSALIVPFPGNNSMFYIFTVSEGTPFVPNSNFSYSVVDMSLNNGNGDVTQQKNILIDSVSTEKLTAVKHSNNIDIWVMVHGASNNSFMAYLVTASGITLTPITSNVGLTFTIPDSKGYMKFSPDGTKIALAAYGTNGVDLFDFNPTTGVVTSEKYLQLPFLASEVYGIEFSPNSNYLYASTYVSILSQWDITSNSASVINSTLWYYQSLNQNWTGALQLGPDKKIYVADADVYMGVINYPNLSGSQCNYIDVDTALWMNYGGNTCNLGLPNFITSYFLPTGISTNNAQENQLSIFPNPADEEFTVSGLRFGVGDEIRITGALGKIIFRKTVTEMSSRFNVQCSKFDNGIYFLSVQTGREVVTGKIVVQHP